ncbi:MAG: ECF transporter S component [Anaerolineae bacterium]|jgi:uncharacterized membrane protein
MPRKVFDPRTLAVTAVMTAIVFVLTRLVQLGPTPVGGYIHLGDVGVFFSAFAFGPWVGGVAGGLGTALADWTSPFAQWGIASLLIHGTQGWVAGWISTRWQDTKGLVLASVIGGAIVVVGYLIAGTFFLGFGVALSEVPLNIIQVTVGAILAVPLFAAVRRAYPPIMNLGRGGQ